MNLAAMLGRYLATREQQRTGQVAEFLRTLDDDEAALIREAAARGHRAGWRHGADNVDKRWSGDMPFPTDREILDRVVGGFRTPPDPDQLAPRQRWLLHESAVMGFVLGVRAGLVDAVAGRGYVEVPAVVVRDAVVQHCQSTSDIYPIIGEDPGGLVRKLMRRAGSRPVPRAVLVRVVVGLMPAAAGRVDGVIMKLLVDCELVEFPDGLMVNGRTAAER